MDKEFENDSQPITNRARSNDSRSYLSNHTQSKAIRNTARKVHSNHERPLTNTSKLSFQRPQVHPASTEQARRNILQVSTISSQLDQTKAKQRAVDNGDGDSRISIPPPKKKTPAKKTKKKMNRYLLATIVLCVGTTIGLTQNQFVEIVRDFIIVVEPDNFFTNLWSDIPIGLNLCFYSFSLKNGKAFYKGAKPHVERLGPFCYRAFRKRDLTEFNEKTVTFYERFNLVFNPDISESLDTEIETINVPIYASILFVRNWLNYLRMSFVGPIVYNVINIALRTTGEKPIERFPVGEFLNGRKINIIALLDNILNPLRRMGIPIPEYEYGGYKIVNQSYGIASLMNHAKFGPIEAYRRSEDGKHAGDIVRLKGKNTWPGLKPPCNKLESSDGVFFPRPVKEEELTVFFYITCRLIRLVKQKEHLLYGISLLRYVVDKEMYTMKKRGNRCFCPDDRSLESCEGLSDSRACFFGLPVEMSMPNFLHYPNLANKFDGIESSVEKDESYFDIDPYLGSPVNVRLFAQGNLHLYPIPSVPVLAKIPEVPFPLLLIQVIDGIEHRKYLIPIVFIFSNLLRYGVVIWFLISVLIASIIVWRRRN